MLPHHAYVSFNLRRSEIESDPSRKADAGCRQQRNGRAKHPTQDPIAPLHHSTVYVFESEEEVPVYSRITVRLERLVTCVEANTQRYIR